MPHNSTGPGKKTTVFLSLRLPLVSGHFVSILRAKNTGRKRTSRDHGCSPVLLPCRSGRMSEIDADQCHFVMPFTGILCNGVASVIMRCPKKTFLGQVWFSKAVIVLRPRWRVLNLSVHFRESYIFDEGVIDGNQQPAGACRTHQAVRPLPAGPYR